ncbi:MAG: hypothetical protein ACK5C8_03590 [Roseiflexaceae bacterium]|jgi:hypothetical protein|nr:hypothetical protein [Chloroflexaceae bacterium]
MDNRQKRIYLSIAGLVFISISLISQYTGNGIQPISWISLIISLVFMMASRYYRDKN